MEPDIDDLICLLVSPWTCNSCQTSLRDDPTCNRTPFDFHRLAIPLTKYLHFTSLHFKRQQLTDNDAEKEHTETTKW